MQHISTRLGLTENVVEEVAIIIVGLKSLIQCWAALKEPNTTYMLYINSIRCPG